MTEYSRTTKGDPKTYAIIGAAMRAHRKLGCGFLEGVYRKALAKELDVENVPYRCEVDLPIQYDGEPLGMVYRADFVCYESIIVELKAQPALGGADAAQVINYLKATGFELGLLLNFGARSLQFERFVWTKKHRR